MLFLETKAPDVNDLLKEIQKNADKGRLKTYIDDKLLPWLADGTALLIRNLIISLIIYFIGKKIIKWIVKLLKVSLDRSSLEEGATGFIVTLVKTALYTVVIIIIAGVLGFQTSSFIALLGSAGVAVGLALQGTLSNVAGGVLILIAKPYRVGDYIKVSGLEGTVTAIDICYTRLATVDNKKVVMPNGKLTNQDIVNVTSEPKRRLDLLIPVGYDEDIERVKAVLTDVVRSNEMVLQEEEIMIFLYSFDASSISMGVRIWTETDNYWPLKWDIQEKIKYKFDQEGISIPYDQLDVNVIQQQNVTK